MKYKNNPGNIRYNPDLKGVIKNDDGFSVFDTLNNGVQAMQTILNTYRNKYGLDTISKIATRYAPTNENNTSQWINIVSQISGINKDQVLQPSDYPKIVMAIIRIETGTNFTIDKILELLNSEKKNIAIISILILGVLYFVLKK